MIDLPLHILTPPEWAQQALYDPLALLNDHFHLEKKAATNALDMMGRWQGQTPPIRWFSVISGIAKDETDHMKLIAKLIAKRNGSCSKRHFNPYARALNDLVRLGTAKHELVDRLLISALIELRSCERFLLLGNATTDPELTKLYTGLWASERGHYHQFLELADWILPPTDVQTRWQILLQNEADIIVTQASGPRIHGWI